MQGRGRNSGLAAANPPLPPARLPAPRTLRGALVEDDARMIQTPRIRSLEERHAALERRISEEDSRPAPDSSALFRLKCEKLRLKEELERLRSAR